MIKNKMGVSPSTVGNYSLNIKSARHSLNPGMGPHTLTSCTLELRWGWGIKFQASLCPKTEQQQQENIQEESPSSLKLRRERFSLGGD